MTEAEVRNLVIATAVQLFSQKGFANVSMNDIVRESGVSKGGVYWHFKSKDEVIQTVLDNILNTQIKIVDTALSQPGSAGDKLRRIFQTGGTEVQDHLPSPLEFYALAARNEALMRRMKSYFDTYRQRVATLIRQGMDEGEFTRHDDPDTLATTVVSFLEGAVIVGLSVIDRRDFQRHLDLAIDFILRGLV
jgi:AcrR family transcriptional regulator